MGERILLSTRGLVDYFTKKYLPAATSTVNNMLAFISYFLRPTFLTFTPYLSLTDFLEDLPTDGLCSQSKEQQ